MQRSGLQRLQVKRRAVEGNKAEAHWQHRNICVAEGEEQEDTSRPGPEGRGLRWGTGPLCDLTDDVTQCRWGFPRSNCRCGGRNVSVSV